MVDTCGPLKTCLICPLELAWSTIVSLTYRLFVRVVVASCINYSHSKRNEENMFITYTSLSRILEWVEWPHHFLPSIVLVVNFPSTPKWMSFRSSDDVNVRVDNVFVDVQTFPEWIRFSAFVSTFAIMMKIEFTWHKSALVDSLLAPQGPFHDALPRWIDEWPEKCIRLVTVSFPRHLLY